MYQNNREKQAPMSMLFGIHALPQYNESPLEFSVFHFEREKKIELNDEQQHERTIFFFFYKSKWSNLNRELIVKCECDILHAKRMLSYHSVWCNGLFTSILLFFYTAEKLA